MSKFSINRTKLERTQNVPFNKVGEIWGDEEVFPGARRKERDWVRDKYLQISSETGDFREN